MSTNENPPHTNPLRLILLLNFPLALSLAIPYSALYHQRVPPIGLIVASVSGFIGLISFPWRKAYKQLSQRHTRGQIALPEDDTSQPPALIPLDERFLFLMDNLLAFFSLLVTILSTLEIAEQHYVWTPVYQIVLGILATLPYVINFCVHSYFVYVELLAIAKNSHDAFPNECPHCHWERRPSDASSPVTQV